MGARRHRYFRNYFNLIGAVSGDLGRAGMGFATRVSANRRSSIVLMASQQQRRGRSPALQGACNEFRQDFAPPRPARNGRADVWSGAAAASGRRRGNDRRLHLCRLARRLRLQPGARRRRRRPQEHARRQDRRGGESPRDRRRRKDHGVDDQSRRRDAAVPDLVRLLQPAHDQDGAEISEAALPALRRAVERQGSEERRQLFRLYRRGAARQRRRRRLHVEERQARFRRRQADPAGAAQHQRLHHGRQARQSEGHHAGDLHRRLVDAGQGSGSYQQPDRPGHRRRHLPRRRPQDRGRERRAPRRHGVRLSRQSGGARAAGLSQRRRVELGGALSALREDVHRGRDHSQLLPRRSEGRDREGLAVRLHGLGRGAQARGRGQVGPDRRRATSSSRARSPTTRAIPSSPAASHAARPIPNWRR